ncbi:tRNA lysidine(34) synthetase TilS [Pedobacter sp. MC2016-14]|uniref:tRNA lysidine(34) synthetase TilS n=1 Tax=Pedobacter sp. MC2016-14 TaxID=2897327 RepID=UPI001E3FEF4D|nr:tRNA lysidine(34) synthetase TilS [Pedobacter sp. MC2016-14]MCD0487929.1 tRNA lysidine(34) synthetase TilS [Pedobacter sp. MC2016-14]
MLPLQPFINYIHTHSLFTADDRILLAVSGGKDSVLMAHLFKLAEFDFGIAHCNFNLRADESQRDEAFVRLLAASLDVPVYVTHFDTRAFAAAEGISTQMAARDLRYAWFEEIRQQNNYHYIALAQHQNDAIETILLNLTRGTGIAGLHGIFPKRDFLIRPLLFMTSSGIEETVTEHHIDYVEDSSNLQDKYARNKIRLNVIPELKLINPNLEQTFQHNIQRFAEAEQVIQQLVKALRKQVMVVKPDGTYFRISELEQLEPKMLLTYELLQPYHFTAAVVAEILQNLHNQSGTSFYSATHRITLNREDLIVSPLDQNERHLNVMLHSTDSIVDFFHQELHISYLHSNTYDRDPELAYVDADLLIFPLIVRSRQEGDKFMPLGMQGFKKLSDFLIDQKVPVPKKDRIPILVNGNGELVWIAGMRQDNRYKVTATTKKVAIFELKFK